MDTAKFSMGSNSEKSGFIFWPHKLLHTKIPFLYQLWLYAPPWACSHSCSPQWRTLVYGSSPVEKWLLNDWMIGQATDLANQIHQKRDLGCKSSCELYTITEALQSACRGVRDFWKTLGSADIAPSQRQSLEVLYFYYHPWSGVVMFWPLLSVCLSVCMKAYVCICNIFICIRQQGSNINKKKYVKADKHTYTHIK